MGLRDWYDNRELSENNGDVWRHANNPREAPGVGEFYDVPYTQLRIPYIIESLIRYLEMRLFAAVSDLITYIVHDTRTYTVHNIHQICTQTPFQALERRNNEPPTILFPHN